MSYNIRIEVASDSNVRVILDHIARYIEQTTGQKCRVTLLNRRGERKYREAKTQEAIDKLGKNEQQDRNRL